MSVDTGWGAGPAMSEVFREALGAKTVERSDWEHFFMRDDEGGARSACGAVRMIGRNPALRQTGKRCPTCERKAVLS